MRVRQLVGQRVGIRTLRSYPLLCLLLYTPCSLTPPRGFLRARNRTHTAVLVPEVRVPLAANRVVLMVVVNAVV